jgi:hypothetical protein
MIYEVIQTITDGLNIFFKTRLRTIEDKAVISGIVNQDGSVAQLEENKVLITLISVEKEPTTVGLKKDGKQRVHINFYVLFSCYFSNANYSEALKFLDFTMNYLNDNSSIDIAESGLLKSTSSGGLKVQVELESLSLDQISHLWGAIGAKTMPSALYKIRMIPLDSNSLKEFRPSAAVLSRRTNQTGGGTNNQGDTNITPGQGNTPNPAGNQNQGSAPSTDAPPANTGTTPNTPPPEIPKNTGKRPVFLGATLGGRNQDDGDDTEDQKDLEDRPIGNTNPRENVFDDFVSKPAAEEVKENPDDAIIQKNDEADRTDDRDRDRDDKGNRDNDVLSKLNPLKRNQGSFFTPFGGPKKPPDSNIQAPDPNASKGSDNPNNDPNKNLNKDSDKKNS